MIHYYITHFVTNFKDTPLRLVDYVSFRAGAAAMTAFLLVLFFGPFTVRKLKEFNAVAADRYKDVDPTLVDKLKSKTPSMGGLLIVSAITIALLLWGDLTNAILQIFLAATLGFALLGFLDDYAKTALQKSGGISGKCKMLFQILITLVSLYFFNQLSETGDILQDLYVPFIKDPVYIMPLWMAFVFGVLVVVGSSNAVNLTDGKDGLAVGCVTFCTLAYTAFAYMTGHKIFADYLSLKYIHGAGEIAVFGCAIAGSCIGFLWHNCHPASMFMGDTGSLALGGAVGLIAVLVKQEILLLLVGWVFVMEAGSVMLQVASFKLTGKRIFLCSPIHHHFEKKGWPETKIVVRFWIIAGVCALLGLATLKLR